MPFGSFIDAVPKPAFFVVHLALLVVGVVLWRGAAGNVPARRGFLLYAIGEFCYITYHLDYTSFLFAHTIAEVLDLLAVLSLGAALKTKTV